VLSRTKDLSLIVFLVPRTSELLAAMTARPLRCLIVQGTVSILTFCRTEIALLSNRHQTTRHNVAAPWPLAGSGDTFLGHELAGTKLSTVSRCWFSLLLFRADVVGSPLATGHGLVSFWLSGYRSQSIDRPRLSRIGFHRRCGLSGSGRSLRASRSVLGSAAGDLGVARSGTAGDLIAASLFSPVLSGMAEQFLCPWLPANRCAAMRWVTAVLFTHCDGRRVEPKHLENSGLFTESDQRRRLFVSVAHLVPAPRLRPNICSRPGCRGQLPDPLHIEVGEWSNQRHPREWVASGKLDVWLWLSYRVCSRRREGAQGGYSPLTWVETGASGGLG
jgi:hypothetical protein